MTTGLIIILLLYILVFAVAEVLSCYGFSTLITRKITHIGGGLISFFLPWVANFQTALIISFVFIFFLFWTKKKQILNSVHGLDYESSGAILFPVGLMFCIIFFWNINPIIFQGSSLILGLSDGLAGILGQKIGRRKYNITAPKTVEGSLVFFLVTVIILSSIMLIYHQNVIGLSKISFIVLGALFLSITEGLLGKGWDNFFLPPLSGMVIYLLLIA